MQGAYFLEASQTLPPAYLALSYHRLAGLMKPFLSFRVSDKEYNAHILWSFRLLLCHKRFHQCGQGLYFCVRTGLLIFPWSMRTIYFDLGEARSFVIEKALEVFTQVDQQMKAIRDLSRLGSTFLGCICMGASSVSADDLNAWMIFEPLLKCLLITIRNYEG